MGDNDKQLMLRVPEGLIDQADALVEPMSQLAEYRMFRMSRSAVMRLALERGLKELEEAHGGSEG